MIWLILPIALGLGFVAARVVFDMQKAHADASIAHQATNMHLTGAENATTPHEAAAHVAAAKTANQVAAIKVTEIAQNATTVRDKQIAMLMAQLIEINRQLTDLTIAKMAPAPSWGDGSGLVADALAAKYRDDLTTKQSELSGQATAIRLQLRALGANI